MLLKIKKTILVIGDIVILYLSLILTLFIRYGSDEISHSFNTHLKPFSVIFILWILIFYLADLYEIRTLKRGVQLVKNVSVAIVLSAALSMICFYLFIDFFQLTPKTNLLIFAVVFGLLDLAWRLSIIKSGYARTRLMMIGKSNMTSEIINHIKDNPQLGYDLGFWLNQDSDGDDSDKLRNLILQNKIDVIVIPSHFIKKDLPVVKLIYKLLPLKINTVSSIDFYETIFQKAPLEELKEGWFIERITIRRSIYDLFKRVMDIILSLILGIVFLPIIALLALLTKLSPRQGPILFKHQRSGINGKPYIHYKFGIMLKDEGEFWTVPEDKRHTMLGRFLRYTHLDETPQLWNILKGDLSFIGPRPERVELTERYKNLPYYEIRHLIKPGLTGWAQINYRPSASVEEAFEKLKYDVYYIKNRSLVLDLLIILKTARSLFTSL